MSRHGGMPIGAFATRHNTSVAAGSRAARRLPDPDTSRPAEIERASTRSTTRMAFIDRMECRTTGNRRGPSGIRYRGDRAVSAHDDPRGSTSRRQPRRADPAHEGNGVRKSRRPTATLAIAHVRQEANLVGPAGVIGSRQVQVDDV